MARTPVVMPKMSMTMTEGEVVELHITVGQKVSQGDVIAVVGTDKTNMEVESDFDGTVLEITSKPGDVIDVGDVHCGNRGGGFTCRSFFSLHSC